MQFAGIVLRVSIIFHGILCVISGTSAAKTTITRDHQDIFEIPLEMCWDDIEKQCNSMGGKQRVDGTNNMKVPCTCQCNHNSTNNVFGWFDNEWKCGTNSAVRTLVAQGCRSYKLFDDKSADASLVTVLSVQYSARKIGSFRAEYYYCKSYTYSLLDCNSFWKQENGYRQFSMSYQSWFDWDLYIYTSYVQPGRIIKLGIKCSDSYWYWNSVTFCLVFKVQGTRLCPVVYPTIPIPLSTTDSPSTTTTTTTTTSTTITTTTETETLTTAAAATTSSQSTTRTKPSLSTTQNTTLFSTQPHTTNIPATSRTSESTVDNTTERPKPTNRTTNPEKHKRGTSKDRSDGISGIIAGVVGGLIGLITVLLILAILWFKKKRNSSAKMATTQLAANNAVYDGVILDNRSQQPPGQPPGDVEYSYAYMSTHPIVIRDQNGTEIQASDMKSNASSPIYNTLEDPDYVRLNAANETSYNVLDRKPEVGWRTPSNSDGPVYNTLEDPSYAKINKTSKKQQRQPSYNVLEREPAAQWNKQNEPFYDALEVAKTTEAPIYNTLEDPNYAKPETTEGCSNKRKDKATRENPIYNVLEGPNSTHDSPFFNVLEDPTESSPVYDELEQPESDHEYNYAGDVIYQNDVRAVDNDVYQQLNQDGQSSMEEQYEPLRHSKMFIAMQDMNGEEKSHA